VTEPTIKWLTREDHALLEEFVYLAIWLPDGTPPLPRDVIRTEPSLRHHWEDFGKVDDQADQPRPRKFVLDSGSGATNKDVKSA
jgi:hypothetical protein